MNSSQYCRIVLFAVALTVLPASAITTVSFVKPTEFTDIGFYGRESSDAMKVLEQHFTTLAERYLAPNQNLKVEVLDVDLAGRIDYGSRRFYDKRVLRGTVDWPSMKFHYVLESDGKVLQDSQADIADMDYLNRMASHYANVSYPHELRMLEAWFKATFSGK
jgi:hypothetical protein